MIFIFDVASMAIDTCVNITRYHSNPNKLTFF